MTATPRAPPTCRVVSLTAEPTPALPSGTEPIIDSVAGAMVSAMPLANSACRQTISGQYALDALNDAHDTSPPVTISRPDPTTSFVPKRCTKRALSGDRIIRLTALGRKR